ncbi:MAG: Mediator of RNA polymerase II transcription subunit 21 [Marteilia pararefringens]
MDALSQLQSDLDELAELMCNSIGIIQQGLNNKQEDAASIESLPDLFSREIGDNSHKINSLINSLPDYSANEDDIEVAKKFENSNSEYQQAANKLVKQFERATQLKEKVSTLKRNIATDLLKQKGINFKQ